MGSRYCHHHLGLMATLRKSKVLLYCSYFTENERWCRITQFCGLHDRQTFMKRSQMITVIWLQLSLGDQANCQRMNNSRGWWEPVMEACNFVTCGFSEQQSCVSLWLLASRTRDVKKDACEQRKRRWHFLVLFFCCHTRPYSWSNICCLTKAPQNLLD